MQLPRQRQLTDSCHIVEGEGSSHSHHILDHYVIKIKFILSDNSKFGYIKYGCCGNSKNRGRSFHRPGGGAFEVHSDFHITFLILE